MKTLILTVGLPRSGKSTWARMQALPVVNPDAIRLAIHGQAFIKEAEPLVWVIAKIMVKALFEAGHTQVILDATNTTQERRDDWLSDLWDVEYKIFHPEPHICIDRAIHSGREDLLPIIEAMANKFNLTGVDLCKLH